MWTWRELSVGVAVCIVMLLLNKIPKEIINKLMISNPYPFSHGVESCCFLNMF